MMLTFICRLIFEQNFTSCSIILLGHLMLLFMIKRIESSPKANESTMIWLTHFVTFVKVLSSISVGIRHNDNYPKGVSIGTMTWMIFTIFAIKSIELDYLKAMAMFTGYWSIYLISLMLYFGAIDPEQLLMFCGVFLLVYQVFKQNYEFSNSMIEMSYELHSEPVLIYGGKHNVKVNNKFKTIFAEAGRFKCMDHYSQILSEIDEPGEMWIRLHNAISNQEISVLDILSDKQAYNEQEFVVASNENERIFLFNFYDLVNVYHSKTIWMFKETTEVHKLEKEKAANKYRSVLMGWLTHELRTPVNWVISGLDSLEYYVVSYARLFFPFKFKKSKYVCFITGVPPLTYSQ